MDNLEHQFHLQLVGSYPILEEPRVPFRPQRSGRISVSAKSLSL